MLFNITVIYENGDKKKCQNCKQIYILNPFIKKIENFIVKQIKKVYKGKESGFTAGQNAADHISQLEKLLQKCIRQQKEVSLICYHFGKT